MAEKPKIPIRDAAPPPAEKPKGNPGTRGPAKDKPKGGGSAKDPYKAAEARANKKEKAAKKAAGKKYLEGAANLAVQAKAIRQALDVDFASARDNNLGDIARNLDAQLTALKQGHGLRAQTFLKTAEDTDMATAGTQEGSYSNALRERQDTLSNILEQGAGETDSMRAMLMSARNWQANVGESNRAYFDSMRSVNSGIVDLNIDTKAQLSNSFSAAEGERDEAWQTFHNNRTQAFTQLGNVLGQQADYYAQAKEMGVKPKKGAEKAAEKAMKKAFQDSSVEAGKGYTQEALPEWISGFTGQDQLRTRQSNTDLAAAVTMDKMAKAEGATLRKWDAA